MIKKPFLLFLLVSKSDCLKLNKDYEFEIKILKEEPAEDTSVAEQQQEIPAAVAQAFSFVPANTQSMAQAGAQMFNDLEEQIEEAKENLDEGSKLKAKTQIDSIKHNLKYLEDNIKKQAGEQKEQNGDKPDFRKIGDLLNKFKGEIPQIE